MTAQYAFGTFFGGFLFPFIIRLCWGKLVETFGPIGGWLAAGFIVGTSWSLNHGAGLIFQSGTAWVDMGWAAGVGLFAANIVVDKADAGKGFVNFIMVVLGGLLGGYLVTCISG